MNQADLKMQEYLKKHPFLQETAHMQQDMTEVIDSRGETLVFPSTEEIKSLTSTGIPLLQNEEWQGKTGALIAMQLPEVLKELSRVAVTQLMQEALQAFGKWADGKDIDSRYELVRLVITQNDADLGKVSAADGLNEAVVRMVVWKMLASVIPDYLKEFEYWQALGWQRNYCPICGRQPVMAHLRKEKEGRARFLVCDGCHTEWPFARVGCVYCGNDDLTKMHILEPEGQSAIRLDVCDKCHAYLKTYNEEGEEGIYLQDWATLHFDMLGEEQNLTKKGSVLLASK